MTTNGNSPVEPVPSKNKINLPTTRVSPSILKKEHLEPAFYAHTKAVKSFIYQQRQNNGVNMTVHSDMNKRNFTIELHL